MPESTKPAAAAAATEERKVLEVTRPAAGETKVYGEEYAQGSDVQMRFDFKDTTQLDAVAEGDNLVINFKDGAKIELQDFYKKFSKEQQLIGEDGKEELTAYLEALVDKPIETALGASATAALNSASFREYTDLDLLEGISHLRELDWGMQTAVEYNEERETYGVYGDDGGIDNPVIIDDGNNGGYPGNNDPDDPFYGVPDKMFSAGDLTLMVNEAKLPGIGSQGNDAEGNPLPDNPTDIRTLHITAQDGVASIVVGGETVFENGQFVEGVKIDVMNGVLEVTRFDPATGNLEFKYTLTGKEGHPKDTNDDYVNKLVPIKVTDTDGDTATGNINVIIKDDIPLAENDKAPEVVEETKGYIDVDAEHGVLANDKYGADGPEGGKESVSGVIVNGQFIPMGEDGTVTVPGKHGDLTLNSDGSYHYELHKNDDGSYTDLTKENTKLPETFTYVIKDADGDESKADLTIELHADPNSPTFTITPGNPDAANTVYEAGLDEIKDGGTVTRPAGSEAHKDTESTSGVIELTLHGEAAKVTIGDLTFEVDDKGNATVDGNNTITTSKGVLTINSITNSKVSYTYELKSHQDHTQEGADHDDFSITIVDKTHDKAEPGTLSIKIKDDGPEAVADENSMAFNKQKPLVVDATHGVLQNETTGDKSGADGDIKVVTVTKEMPDGSKLDVDAGTPIRGQYGTLTLNEDGSYKYELFPDATVEDDTTVKEVFTYTIKDSDGTPSETTLTIDISNKGATIDPTDPAPDPETPTVPDPDDKDPDDKDPDDKDPEDKDPEEEPKPEDIFVGSDKVLVYEAGLRDDLSADERSEYPKVAEGSFNVATPDGMASVVLTFGDNTIELTPDNLSGEMDVDNGVLKAKLVPVPGKDETYQLKYTYELTSPRTNDNDKDEDVYASFKVRVDVTDIDGSPASANITIGIVDDTPVAQPDVYNWKEDADREFSVSKEDGVLYGAHNPEHKADNFGADKPDELAVAGKVTQDADGKDVYVPMENGKVTYVGTYGNLVLNEDGSYTYKLRDGVDIDSATDNPQEVFEYYIVDKDGDKSKTTLTINLQADDRVPTITFDDTKPDPNAPGVAVSGKDVYEAGLDEIPGVESGTIKRPAGTLADDSDPNLRDSEKTSGVINFELNGENGTITIGEKGSKETVDIEVKMEPDADGELQHQIILPDGKDSVVIPTEAGNLTLTVVTVVNSEGKDEQQLRYEYELLQNQDHTDKQDADVTDTFTVSIKDATGDTNKVEAELVVTIHDDAPVVTHSTGSLIVDESTYNENVEDNYTNEKRDSSGTPLYAEELFDINYGADGKGADPVFALVVDGSKKVDGGWTSVESGVKALYNGESKDVMLRPSDDGKEIEGFIVVGQDEIPVLTITLGEQNDITMKLLDTPGVSIDHPAPEGKDHDPSQHDEAVSLQHVSVQVTVEDSDGDKAGTTVAERAPLNIEIQDDGPVVKGKLWTTGEEQSVSEKGGKPYTISVVDQADFGADGQALTGARVYELDPAGYQNDVVALVGDTKATVKVDYTNPNDKTQLTAHAYDDEGNDLGEVFTVKIKDGNVTFEYVGNKNETPITLEHMQPKLDGDGNPVVDAEGNPVMEPIDSMAIKGIQAVLTVKDRDGDTDTERVDLTFNVDDDEPTKPDTYEDYDLPTGETPETPEKPTDPDPYNPYEKNEDGDTITDKDGNPVLKPNILVADESLTNVGKDTNAGAGFDTPSTINLFKNGVFGTSESADGVSYDMTLKIADKDFATLEDAKVDSGIWAVTDAATGATQKIDLSFVPGSEGKEIQGTIVLDGKDVPLFTVTVDNEGNLSMQLNRVDGVSINQPDNKDPDDAVHITNVSANLVVTDGDGDKTEPVTANVVLRIEDDGPVIAIGKDVFEDNADVYKLTHTDPDDATVTVTEYAIKQSVFQSKGITGKLDNFDFGTDGGKSVVVDINDEKVELTKQSDGSWKGTGENLGTITVTPGKGDATFTFEPNANYTNTDEQTISFTIKDGDNDVASTSVTFDIVDTPTAGTDSLRTWDAETKGPNSSTDEGSMIVNIERPESVTITVDGREQNVSLEDLTNPGGKDIPIGSDGTLHIEFNPETGELDYSFEQPESVKHGTGSDNKKHDVTVTFKDELEQTVDANLTINIIDDVPVVESAIESVVVSQTNFQYSDAMVFDYTWGITNVANRYHLDRNVQEIEIADGVKLVAGKVTYNNVPSDRNFENFEFEKAGNVTLEEKVGDLFYKSEAKIDGRTDNDIYGNYREDVQMKQGLLDPIKDAPAGRKAQWDGLGIRNREIDGSGAAYDRAQQATEVGYNMQHNTAEALILDLGGQVAYGLDELKLTNFFGGKNEGTEKVAVLFYNGDRMVSSSLLSSDNTAGMFTGQVFSKTTEGFTKVVITAVHNNKSTRFSDDNTEFNLAGIKFKTHPQGSLFTLKGTVAGDSGTDGWDGKFNDDSTAAFAMPEDAKQRGTERVWTATRLDENGNQLNLTWALDAGTQNTGSLTITDANNNTLLIATLLDGGVWNIEKYQDFKVQGDDRVARPFEVEFTTKDSDGDEAFVSVPVPSVNGFSDEANELLGTDEHDAIYGMGGNDLLVGNGGDDKLYGGEGDDVIFGDSKDYDSAMGDLDGLRDAIVNGTMQESGAGSNDKLFGDAGNDILIGGAGDDYLNGGKDADLLYGGSGNDYLDGGEGADSLYGGAGNDIMRYHADDVFNGGDGIDVMLIAEEDGVSIDSLLGKASEMDVEMFVSGKEFDLENLTSMDKLMEKLNINITDDGKVDVSQFNGLGTDHGDFMTYSISGSEGQELQLHVAKTVIENNG